MSTTATPVHDLPLSLDQLESMMVESVEKFFTTMVDYTVSLEDQWAGRDPDSDEPPKPALLTDTPQAAGMIGFIGDMSGVVYLYLEESFAHEVAGDMLGLEPDELAEEGEETINDVLGEMSNMVVGTFKNHVCDLGFQCRMTIPAILRGTNFTIETPFVATRRLYRFRCGNGVIVADLTMKMGD